MICHECEEHGGFEGDGPQEAIYLVAVVSPPMASEENLPQFLCVNHAQVQVEAYLGWEWAVHIDYLPMASPGRSVSPHRPAIRLADRGWITSLIEGSSNDPSIG